MSKYIYIAIFLMVQFNDSSAKIEKIDTPIQSEQKLQSSGSFITVGGEPNGCHFSSIQDAIDSVQSSGNSVIRIATNKVYFEDLIIDDLSVSLIGGFDDCTAAGSGFISSNGDQVKVWGSVGDLPIMRILGNSQRNRIELKNIHIQNGVADSLVSGGGVSINEANAYITMENLQINGNTSAIGAGIAVFGGNADVRIKNSEIRNNHAELAGGGIYCAGNEASVFLDKGSIKSNKATLSGGNGGGIYVVSDCNLSLYSTEVSFNAAQLNGGGIYAADGALVTMVGYEVCVDVNCFGDNINPVSLSFNEAGADSSGQGEGGAIYATGEDTLISMSEVAMKENTAFNGGAISAREGSDLFLKAASRNCIKRLGSQSRRCNHFDSNSAKNSGGAVYNNGALMEVSQFTFEKNRANFGLAIYAINSDSYVGVTGSNFIRNGNGGEESNGEVFQDFYVVRSANSIVELIHTTFAENQAVDAVFGVSTNASSFLSVVNSIVYDSLSGPVLNPSAGTSFFKCVIAHESTSFTGSEITVANPQFRNIEIGDFHINAQTSPAVDRCQDFTGNGFIDIDTQTGGFDDPTRLNLGGNLENRFDAGSDETYNNDLIFENNFGPIDDP